MLTMGGGLPGENIKLEPNSKPYLIKRIISDGFDTAIIFMLFTVISLALFSSPIAKIYNEHYANYVKVREETAEEFANDASAIAASLKDNGYYLEERFAANLHAYLIKLLAGFIAEAAVLLIVPLLSKTRKTPGKMMTNIMPFCERKRAKASRLAVFGRFMFIFFIDSAFLYLYTGILTFLLVPVIRLTEMLLNKKNKTVCDALSGVMIIEQLSYDGIG